METATIIISILALSLSIFVGFLTWINVTKNDRRAHLSLGWAVAETKKIKVSLNGKVKFLDIPTARIFVNSGTIQSAYAFFAHPYVNHEDNAQQEEYPFEMFESLLIQVNESTNSWLPARRQKNVFSAPSQFTALCPKFDATFLFFLYIGTDGTYKLLMFIYKHLSTKPTLEILDKISCLTYREANNHFYIDQFKNCEQYLRNNNILIQ